MKAPYGDSMVSTTIRPWLTVGALAWSLSLLGCYQGVGDDRDEVGEDGDADSVGEGEDGGEGDGSGDGSSGEELPAPSPRVYRLTHEQWENTTKDIFGLGEVSGLSNLFRDDPLVAGFIFDNDASALEVDEALWTGYRVAAGTLSEQVVSDPALLATWLPDEGMGDEQRMLSFIDHFGTLAYRRPLTEQETGDLISIFEAAPALYDDGLDPFAAGVRHVLETVLQSPLFLYRVESSSEIVDGVIPLSDYEVASRLSYLLWNTMPDEELFAAAAAGSLMSIAEVSAQAERMLDDDRAGEVVVRFHHQLLEVDKISTIAPSANAFPDAPENLAELALEEHERFIRDVVFGGGGGLATLLTSSETFIDESLAAVYGVEGISGDEFVHVDLDPTQRRGLFTQVGFLAANSTSLDPDPIHRGVFMARRVACLDLGAPPDGVPALPPFEPGQTNRERVAAHTSDVLCATCHLATINPFGFAFESFDAIGAWRDIDNGQPVDTAVEVTLGDYSEPVSGAVELADVLAASERVHQCYVEHWIEYATGQKSTSADRPMIDRLGGASLNEQQSLHDLLIALTVSPAFLTRAAQELP